MGKKKEPNFCCSCCGHECQKKEELIKHCDKEHKHQPEVLFDMLGEFVSLEAANIAYKKLLMDNRLFSARIIELNNKNKHQHAEMVRLSKAINIYNEAASGITHTLNLLSTSLDPYKEASPPDGT